MSKAPSNHANAHPQSGPGIELVGDSATQSWVSWAATAVYGQQGHTSQPASEPAPVLAPPDGELPATGLAIHRLEALVYAALATRGDPRRALLEPAARATAAANLLLLQTLPETLSPLDRAGIPYVLIKGASVLLQQPEARGIRAISDVDLLVAPRDFARAGGVLEASDFERADPPLPLTMHLNNERGFVRHRVPALPQRPELHLDLHRGLHRRPLFGRLTTRLLQEAELKEGLRVSSLALSPLVIAAHRAKHGYSGDARELLDFHRMVNGLSANGLNTLLVDARDCGLQGALWMVWAISQAWFGEMGPSATSTFHSLSQSLGYRLPLLRRLAALDGLSDANKPWRHLPFLKMYLPLPLLTDHKISPFVLAGVHVATRGVDEVVLRARKGR